MTLFPLLWASVSPSTTTESRLSSEIQRDCCRWEVGHWEGKARTRRVPAVPPQAKTVGPRCFPASPQLPGAPVLCLRRPSSPPSLERLRNHLSLDPRGRAEEGQAALTLPPAHGHPQLPSGFPLTTRQPPPTPSDGLLFPLLGRGRGKR